MDLELSNLNSYSIIDRERKTSVLGNDRERLCCVGGKLCVAVTVCAGIVLSLVCHGVTFYLNHQTLGRLAVRVEEIHRLLLQPQADRVSQQLTIRKIAI